MIGALGPWAVVGAVVVPLAAVAIVAGMIALTRRGTAPRQPFRRSSADILRRYANSEGDGH